MPHVGLGRPGRWKPAQSMTGAPELSFVIPCYNESGNLRPLVERIRATARAAGLAYEIIITDDCSTDDSWAILKNLAQEAADLRAQRFATNLGQSAALWAGMKAARGRVVVTLDADLQNDPADLPKFLAQLNAYDCVCGSRVEARRAGDSWVRVLSSRVANAVRNWLSGETITDSGCNFRAIKRACLDDLKFFNGMHRFLPTLLKIEGYRVTEIPITNQPRLAGQSKYGVWNRLFTSWNDLMAVRWMKKRMFKPAVAEIAGGGFSPEQKATLQ